MSNKLTEYGFTYGAMEVTRTCVFPDGASVITVKAGKREITVVASPGGRSLRVFSGNKEWKAVRL